jgi:tRNA1Val (adenine37-N6)-methyltransferase
MSNTYFKFKQFTIHQERCAMKVCTDACLLGAYTANRIHEGQLPVQNILDIGTGTGLLSLMLAQKSNALIDAVELNAAAASQAKENFIQSPWAERIQLYNGSIQQFVTFKKYDLIISNPPFFENDLKSGDAVKNDARHDTGLTLLEMVKIIKEKLSDAGRAFILLPYHRTGYFNTILQQAGLFLNEILFIQPGPQHPYALSILLLSLQKSSYKENTLIIHDRQRQYTFEFTALLKDYYLKL